MNTKAEEAEEVEDAKAEVELTEDTVTLKLVLDTRGCVVI